MSHETGQDAREARREQIVEAAKEQFSARGYHNTSVSDIITRVGIARGTFYLYFASKNNIFDAILDSALAGLEGRIERVRVDDGAPPPREQLHESIHRVVSFLLKDRALSRILLNHGLMPDADVAERVNAFYEHVITLIDSSLQYGVGVGLVRACDTRLVAAALFGAIRGTIGHLIARTEGAPASDVDQVVDELLDFALVGVLSPKLR